MQAIVLTFALLGQADYTAMIAGHVGVAAVPHCEGLNGRGCGCQDDEADGCDCSPCKCVIGGRILPTSPELRAALDRWREGFEARPSCAKCGLVCDCGDCRCEAAKAKSDKVGFQYTAAPNVECRNGRCYRVAPVQPVRQQATVRYVPQPAAQVEYQWQRVGLLRWERVPVQKYGNGYTYYSNCRSCR